VSENADSDGDGGAGQGSARLRRVIGRVTSSVGFPESCKRRLELLVRSGVRVEGCRDRVGSSDVEELCRCQKKSGRLPGWVAYTKVDRWDRIKLSSLHRSGNRKLLQVGNRISNYTFVAQKWERRMKNNSRDYIY
jgi:hypothetical protein